jgi:hypothetical protein
MIKQTLGRILTRLGFRSAPQQSPLLAIDDAGLDSYKIQAAALVAQVTENYHRADRDRLAIDSMTTPNELAFLKAYARGCFRGSGKIIDLGCWFGATSAALAAGLRENPKALSNDVIEAYDLFDWEDWMSPIKEQIGMKVNLKSGDCFLDTVQNNLRSFHDIINLHKVDLTTYSPPAAWKIEFLFVDAMKNWDLANSITKNFFPIMIPNGSVVVMQDFAFYDPIVATNHLVMWHLRKFFTPLHHVPYSCSVAFLTESCPTLEDLIDYHPDVFSEEDIEAAYAYCLPLVQESMRPSLLVAKLCHCIMCQHLQSAERSFDDLKDVALASAMELTIRQSLADPYKAPSESWQAAIPNLNDRLSRLRFH